MLKDETEKDQLKKQQKKNKSDHENGITP